MLVIGNGLPWQASFAGAIGASVMSGGLMFFDDAYNRFLEPSKPLWDRSGQLSGPGGKLPYRILNQTTPYFRHAAVILTYMTVVHWITVGQGAETHMMNDPVGWLTAKGGLAALSAVSIGQWKQVQRELYHKAMVENSIENFSDYQAGVEMARRIKVKSWSMAVLVSMVAITLDAMGLGEQTAKYVPWCQVVIGLSGAGTLAYVNERFPEFMQRGITRVRFFAKAVIKESKERTISLFSGFGNACSLAFRRRRRD